MLNKCFGRLTVIAEGVKITQHNYWLCQCSCGNISNVRASYLRSGKTSSCGCLKAEILRKNSSHLNPKKASFQELWRDYTSGAKRNNRIFDLPATFCHLLFQQNCFYCGVEPSKQKSLYILADGSPSAYSQQIRHKTEEWKTRVAESLYSYNGIDRIDNEIGYVLGNCITSCLICNRAKGTKTFEEYTSWLCLVAQNLGIILPSNPFRERAGKSYRRLVQRAYEFVPQDTKLFTSKQISVHKQALSDLTDSAALKG